MSKMMLTKNFSRDEMACSHCDVCLMRPYFMDKLQELRTRLGKPVVITSGYRCPDHNRSIGGARDSQHVKGNAADIARPDDPMEAAQLLILCKEIFKNAVPGPGFIHVDEGAPRTWSY